MLRKEGWLISSFSNVINQKDYKVRMLIVLIMKYICIEFTKDIIREANPNNNLVLRREGGCSQDPLLPPIANCFGPHPALLWPDEEKKRFLILRKSPCWLYPFSVSCGPPFAPIVNCP